MNIREDFDRYFQLVDNPGDQGRYTLHMDFDAANDEHARLLAEMYARGLNYLRLEVDCYTARVSPGDDWAASWQVFCLAPGPDPADVCTDIAEHAGRHNGPGETRSWTDAEVPTAPDTTEGLD